MSNNNRALDLINFKKVSEFLSGKSFNIRQDRSFGKYSADVLALADRILFWMEEIEEKRSNEALATKSTSNSNSANQDTLQVAVEINPSSWVKEKVVMRKINVETEKFDVALDEIYDLQIVSKLPDIDDQVFIDKKQICLYDKYNQGVFYIKWDGLFLMFLNKDIFLKFCKDKEILLK